MLDAIFSFCAFLILLNVLLIPLVFVAIWFLIKRIP